MSNGFLYGQQTRIELGDKYFNQFAYKKAIKLYEGAKDRHKNWQIYAKLGDCYYNISMPENAIENYRKALKKKSNNMDHYRLKYALSLLSIDDCENVIKKLDELDDFKTLNVIAAYFEIDLYLKNLKDLKKLGVNNIQLQICQRNKNPESEIMVEHLDSINTNNSDFGGYVHKNTFYFASSRENPAKKRKLNKRLYKWHDHPYLDIYEATIIKDSLKLVLPDSSKIDIKIKTAAHEASITISNDGKTMYYSGGEVNKKNRLIYNKRGTSNLKLHKAKLVNNKWVIDPDKNNLNAINLENYSVGNPALSPDEKLYFVTCAPYPEAKGQTDIYYVDLVDGKISENPIIHNLEQVNTPGRETFPYISEDNILYFSSDGVYNGNLPMGLLDIYSYDLKAKEDKNNKVITLGKPYNSKKDDFAYFVRPLPDSSDYSEQGYFSSNRDTLFHMGDTIISKGDDDIYRFNLKRKCNQTLRGTIADLKTGEYLENAVVELIDSTGMVLDTLDVSSKGAFNFKVNCDQTFSLRGSNEHYYDDIKKFYSIQASQGINLELKPFPCNITIYHKYRFDTIIGDRIHDKDLLPVLNHLISNPDIKIKIESYTDSRGLPDSNLKLSKERANASKAYLKKAGVNESQIISAEGFGEDDLVISDDEIEKLHNEEEIKNAHQKNRRSLFILYYSDGYGGCEDVDPPDD